MKDAETRFWSKVAKGEGCWEWQAYRNRRGYGTFVSGPPRPRRAHRYSWELHNGPIPKGMGVLHTCDNPPCVNPAHLFLGTNDDNVADKIAKGRGAVGERHGRAKLSPESVRRIREMWLTGRWTQRALGGVFGIAPPTVGHIVRGETWAFVS